VKPPDVKGLSQIAAIQQLALDGFNVKPPVPKFDTRPAGTVIDQNPDANFLIKKGSEITLTVSSGQQLSTVPALVGATSGDAINALNDSQLKYRIDPKPGNYPPGIVLGTNPPAGTRIQIEPKPAKPTVVAVAVSSGSNLVPDVRSLTTDQAVAQLGAAGFGIAIRGVPSSVTPGTVLDQSPSQTYAQVGSDVLIDVAYDPAGPPPSAATPPPSPTPTSGPPPNPSPTP
jgi:serine/threonine-protein kinase